MQRAGAGGTVRLVIGNLCGQRFGQDDIISIGRAVVGDRRRIGEILACGDRIRVVCQCEGEVGRFDDE